MSSQPRNFASATVELVRDTSRRLSADLRDMSRDFSREFRDMGREIRDIHREIGNRFRSPDGINNIPRIEIPRIGLPTFTDNPSYTNTDDIFLPEGQDMENLLDDEEVNVWSNSPQLLYEEENLTERKSSHSSNTPHRLSGSIIRSPRTEEILKNVEDVLRKTDRALRDMLGLDEKKSSGMITPKYCQRELQERISAPPPSPSNFGLSNTTK